MTLFQSIVKDVLRLLEFLGRGSNTSPVPPTLPQNASNPPTPTIPTPAPIVPPQPVLTTQSKATLNNFALAIRDFEGKPGDRNYKNNNPGNARYSSQGYLPMYGKVLRDKDNFAVFKDYATGWLYLKNLIISKVKKNPNQTIYEFMQVYAPSADANDPLAYASNIARKLGVGIDYPMGKIITV